MPTVSTPILIFKRRPLKQLQNPLRRFTAGYLVNRFRRLIRKYVNGGLDHFLNMLRVKTLVTRRTSVLTVCHTIGHRSTAVSYVS